MAAIQGYYRFPTIQGDRVVFVSEDDLFSVSAEGGPARRLSANPGTAGRPVLSPDGKTIAFTGRDEGAPEVFVMPAVGGPARRLTHLGTNTVVLDWRPGGKSVVFCSDFDQPFPGYLHLYEVPLAGGPVKALNVGPAQCYAREPGGKGVVIGRNTGDPARWKRYRGGTAGTLWIDTAGSGQFTKLLDLPGNLAGPMWIGKRIYFLSDHEGVGNLYSCLPSGRSVKRHTNHRDFYVRFPQTDGRRIVYTAGADLYIHDVKSGESKLLEVEFASAQPQRNRKFVDAARHLEDYDLHPEGHSVALVTRGKTFTFPFWEGAVSQHGEPDGVRYRLARHHPDGKRLVALSDESREEELVILSEGKKARRVRLTEKLGRAVDLAVAPKLPLRVAITNHRNELILVDVAKKSAKVVDRSNIERLRHPAWSPDGRFVAYSRPETFNTTGIRILDVETGRTHPVTRPDFHDLGPAFDPEGKHLYFISHREFDPVYDRMSFDLGFPRGGKLMVVPLAKDLASPFELCPRAPGGPPAGAEKDPKGAKNGKDGKPKPVRVKLDLKGIEDRLLAFPLPEGCYGRVEGLPGKVLFSTYPVQGALSDNWLGGEPEAKGTLECYDLVEGKKDTILAGITDFEVSGDGKVMLVQVGLRLRALAAGVKPEPASAAKPPGRESGWLDLSRVRVSVLPGAEWTQMYREAWRLQRDQYWVEDMAGIDWGKVYHRYLPLIDRVAARSEFSDLLWEMQGELGTSHAYELGGDYRPEPGYHLGFLGADLAYDPKNRCWKVKRIPRGDSWKETAASPLAAPGTGIRTGTRILAVGHRPVGPKVSPGERLVHLAGQRVVITVADPNGRRKRDVTVKTLPNERGLRYRDWVEANRAYVHEKTGGRVGYVHIPDMGAHGYAEFHSYFLSELHHDGLLIDVRFNGGGHVSPLLLEKLLRRRVGYDTQRWGEAAPYPYESPAGPIVALTNERAGSDGDIFSHCFKLFGIGPLIGKRTWGGVVGIWPRHALVDGTITTQPEFSFWFEDVGFGVENYGTDPDIEVEILPQDHRRGVDPQMERGLEEILKMLVANPPQRPDFSDRPRLGPLK